MNFASDNVYGVHPLILESLTSVNAGTAKSYAGDAETKAAEERLSELFERDVRAYLVATGTAANGLALSALSPGHGAVICHAEAHIAYDECNSPEFFTGGAKILGLNGTAGKITPGLIEMTLKGFIRGEHDPKPKAVSLTNATELGTVYTAAEVKAVSDLIRPRSIKLHMDGARFANAVVSLGCTPAELTWKAGVDVLSFGGTKNGAMMLEAVVFFEPALADEFIYRRMRAGQLVSKSRYLGAQMLAYLRDELWLENARQANRLTQEVATSLAKTGTIRIAAPVDANIIFAVMPREAMQKLRAAGVVFHERTPAEVARQLAPGEVSARLVVSSLTPMADIDAFAEAIAQLGRV